MMSNQPAHTRQTFRRRYRPTAVLAGAALSALALGYGVPPGASATQSTANFAPAVVLDGSGADAAAVSCWDIKQTQPEAGSGTYWLQTPTLGAPAQFECDMVTDGGGWVLVGRGREGWQEKYAGQGDSAGLLGPRASMATTQLPAATVDGLLDGGRVDALVDGIRVRRAADAAGTGWQEVRMDLRSRDRWVWTFGAEHRLDSYSFDEVAGSGGRTADFGADSGFRRVEFQYSGAQAWTAGFAYGGGVAGSNDPDTFLWSNTTGGGSARPYAEVWIRPRLRAGDVSFTPVPDSGTPAVEGRAVAGSYAAPGAWGVSGIAGPTGGEGNVEVQAFTQSGDRVYVGGNFGYVQRGAAGAERVEQSFLAAFDAASGDFVDSFTPALDGQVKALATLPDGRVVAGGQFSQVNGAPATSVVALDPVTGDTSTGWDVTLENRLTSGVLLVRSLSVQGDSVFIGGALTHLTGGTHQAPVYARGVAQVSALDGTPNPTWNPEFNGTVVSLDAADDGARLYASGYFTTSRGAPALKAAAVQTGATADLAAPAWSPVWSASANYQQAIRGVDERVWVGGSEHSLFSFSTDTFDRLSGNITKTGGDFQTITDGAGVVYGGCHCNNWTYSDAYTWTSIGSDWTQADAIGWIGAWDAATGDIIPDFNPTIGSGNGAGAWSSFVAADGTLWTGGDFVNARTGPTTSQWAGGFLRFPEVDHTAPTSPGVTSSLRPTEDTVRIDWTASTDTDSAIAYEVLRDDRVVATTTTTTATLQRRGADRYFVRAVDTAGNRSPSTPLVDLPPVDQPPVDQPPVDQPPVDQPPVDLGDPTLIPAGSDWTWLYRTKAPSPRWRNRGFRAAAWSTGPASLGFGSPRLGTRIGVRGPTSRRPVTAYFRRTFKVHHRADMSALKLRTRADDGVVVYVNGVEVRRTRMRPGPVTHTTLAKAARRTPVARAKPVIIRVPLSLLVDGRNTVSAEVHLRFRGTRDISFDLEAEARYG